MDALAAWTRIPGQIQAAIRGLSDEELDLREDWSIRETVHHLVEANLIAANMILAALANEGYQFDWTWVNPDRAWMKRTGYDKADVRPALAMLRGLCRHIAELIAVQPRALKRRVSLNDAPGAERYFNTVEEILQREADHARDHLAAVRTIRKTMIPARPR